MKTRRGAQRFTRRTSAIPASIVFVCRSLRSIVLLLFSLSLLTFSGIGSALSSSETTPPTDPLFGQQWYLKDSRPAQLHFQQAWNITTGSDDIIIAVIDTGIDPDHEDLTGRLVNGWDFVNNDPIPEDEEGHGTQVAGVIAATANNSTGIAGITWGSRIMPLKVTTTGSWMDLTPVEITTARIIDAVHYAVDNDAKVINLSMRARCQGLLTSGCTMQTIESLHDAFRYAYDHGVTVVAASGNNNVAELPYPAVFSETIAVGATGYDDQRCGGIVSAFNCGWLLGGSSYGNGLDLVAPGRNIWTTSPNDQYGSFYGTSSAAPQVSGLVALMLSVNPNLTPYQVQDILQRTTYKRSGCGEECDFSQRLDEGGWNRYVGFGRIDAYSAVNAVANPPSVQGIRILLKAVLERSEPPSKDYSSQVAVVIQRRDLNRTRIWGPQIVTTDSGGYSSNIVFTGLGPGTYDVCAKPKYHLGMCKTVTLSVGQNPTIDFSDGGTQGAWPGDIDVYGEDNLVNGLDASAWTNYAYIYGLGQPGPYDFNRDGVTNSFDMGKLVQARIYHPQGEGKFDGPFPHGVSGTTLLSSVTATSTALEDQAITAPVSLYFQLTGSSHQVGDTFDVEVVVNTNGTSTNATDAILHYDPGVFEVVDMDPGTPGVQVTMGSAYPVVSENVVDPEAGLVHMGARSGSGSFSGVGTLATVRFHAIAGTGGDATELALQFMENDTTRSISAEDLSALNKLGSAGSALQYVYGSPTRPLPIVSFTPSSDSYVALLNQPISATVQDPYDQIQRVDFSAYYDGTWHSIGSDTNGVDGWSVSWDNLGIADQLVSLRAIAWLPGDLYSSQINSSIHLDRTAPMYSSSSFAPVSPSNVSNVQVSVSASDDLAGVQRVELYVNSALDGSISGDWLFQGAAETGSNATISWNTSGFTGTHQMAFAIKDYAGNWMRWDSPGLPVITYTLDFEPPVVAWVMPVTNEQVYNVFDGVVQLEVSAADSSGIDVVTFDRWDAVNLIFVDLGVDYSVPYTATVDVSTLNLGWNQVDTQAVDKAGNSTWKYIWIHRETPICVYLPVVLRHP